MIFDGASQFFAQDRPVCVKSGSTDYGPAMIPAMSARMLGERR